MFADFLKSQYSFVFHGKGQKDNHSVTPLEYKVWCICCYGVFTLRDSDSYADSETDSNNMQKGYTGTNSDGNSDAKLQ